MKKKKQDKNKSLTGNPDWVISEEYPRKTLREKCEND